jgi:histidinol-phosphate aminotransferase
MRAKPSVEALEPYVAPLEGRRGLLRLDFNENTVGPSPRVVAAIRALPPEAYATYPEYGALTARYARHVGVDPGGVALFNGSDAAIKAVFDAFGRPADRFVTTSPTFGYYRPCAEIAGMQIVGVPYEPNFDFPWGGLRRALAEPTRICIVCNPNNPTSTLVGRDDLLRLVGDFPATLFVIDEIYASYTGVTVLPEGAEFDNLVALHSLSKSCGIAALRIGFACGAPAVVERMKRVTGPYDINQFGVVAAHAVLDDWSAMTHYADEVARAKAITLTCLEERGVRCYSGGGNYFLVWPGRDVAEVESALRARGVLVRSMQGKPLLEGCFRLSVGTREQMQRFVQEFDAVDSAGGTAAAGK